MLAVSLAGHTEIGRYTELGNSSKLCGRGQHSQPLNDSCFEWYERDEFTASIRNGRRIVPGEVPYLTYIYFHIRDTRNRRIGERYSYLFVHDNLFNRKLFIELFSKCSGSIINENMAITAVHCFE